MSLSSSSQTQGNAHEVLRSSAVPHTATVFQDTFWASRLQTLRTQTLPAIYQQMRLDGHFTGFHESWHAGMRPIPYVFWESDIAKWIEAASYSLALQPDPDLEALVDEAIAFLLTLQQPDGYLNLWFTQVEPEQRWSNLRDYHELYCAGHLIEAAVAHFQATGQRILLDAVCRYADYIDATFGPEEGKRRGYCGHEEIELALIKLSRITGERRYMRLSHYFIEERGQRPSYFDLEAEARGEAPADYEMATYEYNQSHVPVREQHEIVGHAVRAMYLFSAVADLARELEDESLRETCEHVWNHLQAKRLYITGGLGSSEGNEGFTADYDLPNSAAYAETCAAIGLVMWSQRLLQLDADQRYADVLEQALYNGVLSGIALDGNSFFYVNPLESAGTHHRQPWFKCACCPPNIARLLLSIGSYFYTVTETDILVHLYAQSSSTLTVGSQSITLHQYTNYPWDGIVRLEVECDEPVEFGLHVRIPGWCPAARLTLAGAEIPYELRKGYARVTRTWQPGESLTLHLTMPVERIYPHPAIRENVGKVALRSGPLIYCLESQDNPIPLQQFTLPSSATFEKRFVPDLLGGIAVLNATGRMLETADWDDTLYRTLPPTFQPFTLTAIPYYAWAQREPGEMCIWLKVDDDDYTSF
ncbi:MAG TPA: beta-L-arabinofuranosidase domain-containing protein [Ktedonobacteraceae bacterium]